MTSKEGLQKDLQEKAKSAKDIEKKIEHWRRLFSQGASGNQEAYIEARDTRHLVEEPRYVSLDDLKDFAVVPRAELSELIERSKRTAFQIQDSLDSTKTLVYPHDYWWIPLKELKELLGSEEEKKE